MEGPGEGGPDRLERDRRSATAAVDGQAMTVIEAVTRGLSLGATFRGRASRSEFWWFALVYGGALTALLIVGFGAFGPGLLTGLGPMLLLAALLATPLLAAGYRRLHDTGLPGWLALIPPAMTVLFVPMFYLMWMLGGDARPQSDLQFAVAQALAFLLYVMRYGTLPAWVILAILLVRPGQAGANAHGAPPAA